MFSIFFSKEIVKTVASPITCVKQNEISNGLPENKSEENNEIMSESSDIANTENDKVETVDSCLNDAADKTTVASDNEISKKTTTDSEQCDIKTDDPIELKSLNDEITTKANTTNTSNIENTNSNQLELCNGDLQEAILDNTSNIDVPTLNTDDNVDGVEGDFDFDQIYDDLQEKNQLSAEVNVESDELKVPSPNADEDAIADENVESKENIETTTAINIDDLEEDLFLKSPSLQEKCDELPEYSESVLLKDDSKEDIEPVDNEEGVTILNSTYEPMEMSSIEQETDNSHNEVTENKCEETENANEPDIFDLLKTSETVKEANQVDAAFENLIEKSTKETEQFEENKLVSVKQAEHMESSTLVADENSDSMVNPENKENNLLEAMAISPISADIGESSSSFRDDDVANGNEFCDQVIDSKDENSTDARDGFNDDKNMEDTSNDSKNTSIDVSQSNENSVILTDQLDSVESKPGIESTTNEKSNESMIAISLDDDDDDVIIEESATIPNKISTEDDQPPAKRARLESTENDQSSTKLLEIEVPTIDEKPVDDAVETEKIETTKTTEKIDNTVGAENLNVRESAIEDDDDDLVIIESTDTKELSSNANSNKRPASPIDAEEETHKKHKSDAAKEIPNVDEVKVDETAKFDKEQKNVPEEKREKVEQLTEPNVELKSTPKETVKRTIALDFAEKFKKGLNQMSRKNLEEFVLEKIIEAIVHKSDYSDLKQKSDAQEQMIQVSRTKLQEISKQYRDLEMVYARLKKDLENKNQNIVTPIKITRAVGLQVCLQKAVNKEGQSVAPTTSKTVQKTFVTTPQVVTRTATVVTPQSKVVTAQKPITPVQRPPVKAIATRQVTPEQRVVTTGNIQYFL